MFLKKTRHIFLIFFIFSFCTPRAPINIESGKEECVHCKMRIVDLKFNTQLQTDKGRILHFDSIECLINWIKEHPEVKIKNAWVKDYLTGEWIEYKKAIYFISKDIPSPMGANLSAYKEEKEIENLKQQNKNGSIYKYEDLLQNIDSLKHYEHHQ
jgi:copper chaperone NosL